MAGTSCFRLGRMAAFPTRDGVCNVTLGMMRRIRVRQDVVPSWRTHDPPHRHLSSRAPVLITCVFVASKQAMRKLCKEMNERFLCPMESDALKITLTGSQVPFPLRLLQRVPLPGVTPHSSSSHHPAHLYASFVSTPGIFAFGVQY